MTIILPKRRDAKCEAVPIEPLVDHVPAQVKLLTVKQAAAFIQVSQPTIRRWIRERTIHAYKAGVQVRIDRVDLLKLLCSNDHG